MKITIKKNENQISNTEILNKNGIFELDKNQITKGLILNIFQNGNFIKIKL